MKTILIFDLPDEDKKVSMMLKADDMAFALWEISQYLRSVDKYETGDDIEKIRERFYDILHDNDVNLDKLIE